MKTRTQIYKKESDKLLQLITTYHTLHYDQVLQFFSRNRDRARALITSLTNQGRIYYNKDRNLLCDTQKSADSPNYGMIAAFWVLLDFKKAVVYHSAGKFPVILHFLSQDEIFEIIYIGSGQETLINRTIMNHPSRSNRLIILESEQQAAKLSIDSVIAYCLVSPDGTVSYYKKIHR